MGGGREDDTESGPAAPDAGARALSRPPAPQKRSLWGWMARLRDDVSISYADLPVLACCVVSGLCDSVAFNAGGVFVAMQTGNTIFLALGASAPSSTEQPPQWLEALTSLGSFWVGCLFFSSMSRLLRPRRKATLSVSFLVQAAFVLTAAALSQTRVVPAFAHSGGTGRASDSPRDARILLPLALLAFQFGGQIVTSRILGFNEVPTNVLTSVYCDLLSDPRLLAPLAANPKRNRRFAAAVLLVAGGVAGGWLQRSSAGMAAALWVAAAIKVFIAFAWLAWSGKRSAGASTESQRGAEHKTTPAAP